MIQQSGAVPIQFQNDEPMFLVINNLNRTRWLVPKGIIEDGQTSAGTAAKEAMEEAGITGEILEPALGVYTYSKWDDVCSVDLFILFVKKIYETWEEDNFRERHWINWKEFLKIVDERIPRSLLDKIPEVLNTINNLKKKETRL
jgi:8-oxo-dGTP pyrophosphatase MutT (NUDIX family)